MIHQFRPALNGLFHSPNKPAPRAIPECQDREFLQGKHSLTEREFLEYIRHVVSRMKQQEFAALIDCNPSFISDVLRGNREPGPRILAALGFQRVVTYEEVNDEGGDPTV
jgi:hypothetical protein